MDLEFLGVIACFGVMLLLGASISFDRKELPDGLKLLTDTGILFIALGFVFGPQVLNVVSRHFVENKAAPLLTLGLGWIGFLYGSHFEFRRMKRFPLNLYVAGIFESLTTSAILAVGAYFLLLQFKIVGSHVEALTAALALSVCAAGTAPGGVFLLQNNRTLSRQNVQTLQFFAAIDDLPAIALLGLVFAIGNTGPDITLFSGLERIALSLCFGVGVGIVTHWVFPHSGSTRHNALILFGVTAFASGLSESLHLSAVFVTTVAGMVFANLSHLKEQAYGVFSAREYELYAVFLLFAGVLTQFQLDITVFYMVGGFVVLRSLGKLVGAYLAKTLFIADARISRDIGLGLLFQGGMALAFAVEIEKSEALPLKGLLVTTVVAGVILNDLLAPGIAGFAMAWERNHA